MSISKAVFRTFHALNHLLKAGNEHDLHSPFLYQWYVFLKHFDKRRDKYSALSKPIKHFYQQHVSAIEVIDFGAGGILKRKTPVEILKRETLPAKWSTLVLALIRYHQPKVFLELGTSTGISTAIWSSEMPFAQILTFEGSPQLCRLSCQLFEHLRLNSIELIEGNLDQTLAQRLFNLNKKVDFVFIDANHRLEPTVRYVEQLMPYLHDESIVVLDDINFSSEMYKAWNQVTNLEQVKVSIEFRRIGVLMFRSGIHKQHFRLK